MKIKNLFFAPLLFFSVSGLMLLSFKNQDANPTKWVINKVGYLQVKGKTSVNTFTCVISNYIHPDTISIYKNKNLVKLSGEIALNINDFDCHNAMMTVQLRKTLKAEQYPKIKISFISLDELPELTSQKEHIKGCVDILIANVNKRYNIDYELFRDSQNNIHLTGVKEINFTDFKLKPPTKLGGIIKAKDKLGIEFQLQFKEI